MKTKKTWIIADVELIRVGAGRNAEYGTYKEAEERASEYAQEEGEPIRIYEIVAVAHPAKATIERLDK